MFAAKGTLSPDDLGRAAATFDRLQPETARRIVDFREQRARLRAQGAAKVAVLPSPPPQKA
jgi:hypothetical protein